MVVPLGLELIANRVADNLSMISVLAAPHNGPILPETMLRTHEAFEEFGAAYSISLDCGFLSVRMNPPGMKTMLSGSAALRGARAAPLCTSGSMFAKHGFVFLLC